MPPDDQTVAVEISTRWLGAIRVDTGQPSGFDTYTAVLDAETFNDPDNIPLREAFSALEHWFGDSATTMTARIATFTAGSRLDRVEIDDDGELARLRTRIEHAHPAVRLSGRTPVGPRTVAYVWEQDVNVTSRIIDAGRWLGVGAVHLEPSPMAVAHVSADGLNRARRVVGGDDWQCILGGGQVVSAISRATEIDQPLLAFRVGVAGAPLEQSARRSSPSPSAPTPFGTVVWHDAGFPTDLELWRSDVPLREAADRSSPGPVGEREGSANRRRIAVALGALAGAGTLQVVFADPPDAGRTRRRRAWVIERVAPLEEPSPADVAPRSRRRKRA